MSKLYVGTADNLNAVNDLVSLLLQSLLQILRYGEHRRCTEGITCVYAHGINIFDEADGDHVAVLITDNFQLQLFPACHTFLNQYLAYGACLQTSCAYGLELFLVIYQTAAGTAHGICGTQNYGISQIVCYLKSLVNAVAYFAARHAYAKAFHGLLEFDTVLTALNGIYLNADNLYAILIKYALFIKLSTEVKSRLTAKVGKQRIRSFFLDDLLKPVSVKRLDVSNISHFRIRHDGRGI